MNSLNTANCRFDSWCLWTTVKTALPNRPWARPGHPVGWTCPYPSSTPGMADCKIIRGSWGKTWAEYGFFLCVQVWDKRRCLHVGGMQLEVMQLMNIAKRVRSLWTSCNACSRLPLELTWHALLPDKPHKKSASHNIAEARMRIPLKICNFAHHRLLYFSFLFYLFDTHIWSCSLKTKKLVYSDVNVLIWIGWWVSIIMCPIRGNKLLCVDKEVRHSFHIDAIL